MKTRLLTIIGIMGLSLFTPQSFGDNDFCNIQENLKIQEELIQDDIVLIEFLKVFPDAKLIRANFVEGSNPLGNIIAISQTSVVDDRFVGRFQIDGPLWEQNGIYTISVRYGEENTVKTEFLFLSDLFPDELL